MLYAVSDVHGYREDLVAGLRAKGLLGEDESWTGGDDQLWLLGDYLDRGPDGIGVIDLVMSLQRAAPENVHPLMGNHEALALGRHRFPDSEFGASWVINGGRQRDQDALTDEHVAWLAGLPVAAVVDGYLLLHSDSASYLGWGSSVAEINATVADMLAGDDLAQHWEVWSRLTSRGHFASFGDLAAQEVLDVLGGTMLVHGHSMIATLVDTPSAQVTGPVQYADGLVLAIDGGRYDDGPLLVVALDR